MHALRLIGFLGNYKRRTALALFCVSAAGVFVLAMPLIIGWAVKSGLGIEKVDGEEVATGGDRGLLVIAAVAIVCVALLRGLFAFGQTYLGEWLGQRVAYDLRNGIYDRLQRLSYAYHDQQQTGQLMSRATQDVEAVRMFIQMGVLRFVYVFMLLIATLAIMLVINWKLALVVWVFLPFITWRAAVMSLTVRPLWMKIQNGMARLTTVLQESLTGARVVKAFAREEYERQKFGREADALFEDSFRSSQVQAVNTPIMSGLWLGAAAAVLWFGGWRIISGDLAVGGLVTFLLYLTILQVPVRSLGWIVMIVTRAQSAGQRIFEVLDAESAVRGKADPVDLATVKGHLRFEDVSFGYDSIAPVLEGIDIDARPGQVVALMGPTGSGKTTVVNLMPRFYDATGGRITIDGVDLRDASLASLRTVIGSVQQEVFLFSATVRDNIAYGAVGATHEQIEAAAKAAYIHDFIEKLPDGYDTWVGERGITLSGGQKQRVALARTILMNPCILILDDSTSSVDTETEYLIQKTLAEFMKGRTTFVIAQRLRTVKMADQILVLEDGRIVERGHHQQLLRNGGLYRQIYDLELRDQEEALKSGQTPGQVAASSVVGS